jgi:hypothetical protein
MKSPLILPIHIQFLQQQCQCRFEQHRAFLFLALVLPETYDVVLHLIFDLTEIACQAFHSTFEPFLLAFV